MGEDWAPVEASKAAVAGLLAVVKAQPSLPPLVRVWERLPVRAMSARHYIR
jgi:hypothetical protein